MREAGDQGLAAITSPEALGLSMLKADPAPRRLHEHTQLDAVAAALADGAATARDLRQRFPGLTAREIAHELRIPVVTTSDDPMVGPIWRFAEYRPGPPTIVLYTRGLEPLERALVGQLASQLLGRAT